jgi:hypothetical protein
MRTDPYVETGARPEPGTLWVWEPRSLAAVTLLEVTQVQWDGKQWRVKTRVIAAKAAQVGNQEVGGEYWNELSRFWEACHRVSKGPGVIGTPEGIRRGPLRADERQPPD